MKINLSIIALSLLSLAACNSEKMSTTASKGNKMETSKMSNTHTLELKKGELFLVAIADQKEGKEALLQEYFGTIMPSAMKNGFTPLGQLHIDNIVKANNFTPNNFIGLFKWPNMTSVQAFMSDFTPEQLKELRIPIWNEFKAHMIALQEDKTFMIDESNLYEVKTLWTKDMVKTNSITENGGKVILNQPVAGYEDLKGNEAPNQILIIEWKDKKTADKFEKMNMLKSKKEEAFYTHFTLFQ
ncbi:hypothetical protein [Reichenbachiella versicolor]|uniref:hypothetical protein n=1 Tax=Reichenbachiella versicolor TaxID=1821036 RepID=UPI000D6DDA60|nr:hypothetical protein [Reichenbachiella versicolor]